jgi:hypothetical protein
MGASLGLLYLTRHSLLNMLKVIPHHWFTWNCGIVENRAIVGSIDFSIWGEAGELKIQDESFRAYRESADSSNFYLADQQRCVAIAAKPNPLFRQFFIRQGETRYELQATSALGRKFIVQEYGQVVGSIYPVHAFTRQAIVDLPESIPLSLRLFMVWLVLTLWRRQKYAAS